MKSQITTNGRTALAGLLMILSVAPAFAESTSLPFKGGFDARDNGVVQFPVLTLNGSGAGTASRLGRFTFTSTTKVDLTNALSTGTIQLTAANGDAINGMSVGRGEPTGTANITHVVLLVTVTGGTGRFRGVTGSFTMDSILVDDPQTGIGLSSGSLKGTLHTLDSEK
jgi:hypothetical protein